MVISNQQTNIYLEEAVQEWCTNENYALSVYGDINTWDVSGITDMSGLFESQNRVQFRNRQLGCKQCFNYGKYVSQCKNFQPRHRTMGCGSGKKYGENVLECLFLIKTLVIGVPTM